MAICAGASVLTVAVWLYGGVERIHVAAMGLAGAGILGASVWAATTKGRCFPLDLPVALLFCWCAVMWLFADYREPGLLIMYQLVACAAVYFISSRGCTRIGEGARWLWVVAGLACGGSVYGLVQYFGFLPHEYWADKTMLSSRYVNSNHFAGLLELGLLSAVGVCIWSRRRLAGTVAGVAALLIAAALVLAKSRAGWLSAGVGMGIFGGVCAFGRKSLGREGRRRAVIVFALLLAVALLGAGSFARRFSQLEETRLFSLIQRGEIWKGSLKAFMGRPVGWGLGRFDAVYPAFRTHSDRFSVHYAHSEYLHAAVELGFVGLIMVGWGLWRQARTLLRGVVEGKRDIAVWGGLAGASGAFLLHSAVDFELHVPANAMAFSVILGVTSGLGSIDNKGAAAGWRKRMRGPTLVLVSIFLVWMALSAVKTMAAERHFRRAESKDAALRWEERIGSYEKAIRWEEGNALYYERLGLALLLRSALAPAPELRERALREFAMAVELDARRSEAHVNLGRLYDASGQDALARKHYAEAVRLAPKDGRMHLFYAEHLLSLNERDRALEEFGEALHLFPTREEAREILKTMLLAGLEMDAISQMIGSDEWLRVRLEKASEESAKRTGAAGRR